MQRDGICSGIYRLSWKMSYGLYTGCPGGRFKSLYTRCPGGQFTSLYTGCAGCRFKSLYIGCPGGRFTTLYIGCPGGRFTLYTGCSERRFIKRGEVWNCDNFKCVQLIYGAATNWWYRCYTGPYVYRLWCVWCSVVG
jgi:hypothetical protein